MRKVYKNFIRSIAAGGCICLFTGCGIVKSYSGAETTVNDEEISEEQFIAFSAKYAVDGKTIRVV